MSKSKKTKICLVSSSGGHWEQLKCLGVLSRNFDIFYVTEKTAFSTPEAKYLMKQTDLNDKLWIPKMFVNTLKSVIVCVKERPDVVITTGTLVAFPFYLYKIIFKKKFIFIETFGRANMPTKAGKMMEKHSDLFIVQWESQVKHYEKAIYGGVLY